MKAGVLGAFMAALLVLSGCSSRESSQAGLASAASAMQASVTPDSFINRVWEVSESDQVARGSLRVFLSDGTLVMASSHATPALGTWRYQDGHLTITEEGQQYKVDILSLSRNTFRIRIHSPGEPVVIRFAPAAQHALQGNWQ